MIGTIPATTHVEDLETLKTCYAVFVVDPAEHISNHPGDGIYWSAASGVFFLRSTDSETDLIVLNPSAKEMLKWLAEHDESVDLSGDAIARRPFYQMLSDLLPG